MSQSQKKYYEKNKELVRKRASEWNRSHEQRRKEITAKYIEKNKEKVKESHKRYSHKPENKEKRRIWTRNYRKTERGRLLQKLSNERRAVQIKANMLINDKIKSGTIKRGNCIMCGLPNAQAHHPDYSKPLDIVWLCVKHHTDVHKNNLDYDLEEVKDEWDAEVSQEQKEYEWSREAQNYESDHEQGLTH